MFSRKNYSPYILRKEGDNTVSKCSKCLEEKEPSEYYVHSFRKDGYIRYRPVCKSCRRVDVKKRRKRPVYDKMVLEGNQKCKKCNIEKPLDFFYSNGCFSDGTKKYRTKCKDCVLIDAQNKHKLNYGDKIRKKHSSYKNYISTLLNHCSKRKNKSFNIDIQHLIDIYESQNGICAISGEKMTFDYGAKMTNISIDRINSALGYIKGNVHLVCYIVNIMKSDFSISDLVLFSEKIVNYNKIKNNVIQNIGLAKEGRKEC